MKSDGTAKSRIDARFGINVKVYLRELDRWLEVDNVSHSGFLLLEEIDTRIDSYTVRVKYFDNEFAHVIKARKIREVAGKWAFVFKFFDKESSAEFNEWLDEVALQEIQGKFLSWNDEEDTQE